MHYVTSRSHRMQKHMFGVTCPNALLVKSILEPPSMKNSASTCHARMHQNALCDPQIPRDAKTQVQHNMCRRSFMESLLVSPEHEKYCVDILCPRRTRLHYVTPKSHCMQKHNFSVTHPDALFVKSVLVPPKHEK
jgi:hypothetical protein